MSRKRENDKDIHPEAENGLTEESSEQETAGYSDPDTGDYSEPEDEPYSDPDMELTSVPSDSSDIAVPDEIPEYWEEEEPVAMELGAHEINTVLDDNDPDAPLFTETSTRPADAVVTEKGKKINWKPRLFLIAMGIIALIILCCFCSNNGGLFRTCG